MATSCLPDIKTPCQKTIPRTLTTCAIMVAPPSFFQNEYSPYFLELYCFVLILVSFLIAILVFNTCLFLVNTFLDY